MDFFFLLLIFFSLKNANFIWKQCQIAVLPLGTGNDLARVLGWGSSCDDNAHLPQLLERYEKSSTKMLDRWSVMVYERDILREPKMSISHHIDPILTSFEQSVNWHLQVNLFLFYKNSNLWVCTSG